MANETYPYACTHCGERIVDGDVHFYVYANRTDTLCGECNESLKSINKENN